MKPAPAPTETKTRGTIVSDPEGVALHSIMKILVGLEAAPRARVLRYINDRFDDACPLELPKATA